MYCHAFSKFIVVSCALAAVSVAGTKNVQVTVDSLVGNAEIQKAGQQQWKPIALGAHLSTNDIVRVLDKSFLRLAWPDGATSFVHANSQVLVNLYESSETNIISAHLTILYGAVFFVIKEVLPKAFTKPFDTKVYTPTAVVSVRGTSFAVEVDNKTGATSVKVVNGTVLVGNNLKNVSSFITAGFQTYVELKTDPITGKLLLDKDINDLKTWVPIPVIERELSLQIAKAGRDHEILAGGFKDKLVILPFENRSRYSGQWNIATALSLQLTEQLKQVNKNITVDNGDAGAVDPLKLGEEKKARFVIIGDIEDFDIVQHAEITVRADEYNEFYIARVRLHIQLIDVADKKLVLDNVFSGETRGKNLKENSWQRIGKLALSLKDKQFSESILGNSLQQVMDQTTDKIIQFVNYQ
jgi:FecR protein.